MRLQINLNKALKEFSEFFEILIDYMDNITEKIDANTKISKK